MASNINNNADSNSNKEKEKENTSPTLQVNAINTNNRPLHSVSSGNLA